MKKVFMSFLIMLLVSNGSMAFADGFSAEKLKNIEDLMVEDLLTDPRFEELNFEEEAIIFFAKIQKMSDAEKQNLLSPQSRRSSVNSLPDDFEALYNKYGAQWGRLTHDEKLLLIANPIFGALAYSCVGTANELTIQEYGHNRVGDESDAFRHTVWNALMQKYIGGSYPKKYATAHESYPASTLNVPSNNSNGVPDGYLLQDHTDMDLHNNEVGRSLVNWTEYFTISHETIVERVHDAIDDGRCYFLYSY